MKPIVIQGAMPVEVVYFVEKLSSVTLETRGNHKFYKGFYQEYPIIIAETQIGMVNSSISTTLACTHDTPSLIINQGIAGAHSPTLHVGDIVLGERAVAINSFEKPLLKSGVDYKNWSATTFYGDDTPRKADSEVLALFENATYEKGQKIQGVLGCGDVWNREWEFIHWLHTHLHTSCEDMESLACYQVAQSFQVPVMGLRIISNNELLEEAYVPEVATTLQGFLLSQLPDLIAWAKK